MADVTIDASCNIYMNTQVDKAGPVWISTSVGYVFYIDSTPNLVYRKTTDGGNTWSAAVTISAVTIPATKVSVWFDKWTTGDTGTKIYISWICYATNGACFRTLDTATDTFVAAAISVYTTVYVDSTNDWRSRSISITKSRGGNLYLKFDLSSLAAGKRFYRSTDGGVNWTSRTNYTTTSYVDNQRVFPANLADSNDIWCLSSADDGEYDFDLLTYDDSADSWSAATINDNVRGHNSYNNFWDGAIRQSDGHLICAVWNMRDDAAADLLCYDITNEGTITAKTNVITNLAESVAAAVGVTTGGDIYVGYLSGTAWGSAIAAKYKKSTDGGTTWGTAVVQQADAEADMRGVWIDSLVTSTSMVWWNYTTADLMCPTVVLPATSSPDHAIARGIRRGIGRGIG